MGGGVANLFRSQGIDALRVVRIFILLVPVAISLVLPIAALFGATITFGRASADNEINACRAAGINVHRLLLTPLLLSVGVAGLMYYSWNYVIPRLSGKIYDYSRDDIATLLLSQLRRNRGVEFGNRVLYADSTRELQPNELPPDASPEIKYVQLRGAAFLETEAGRPLRLGTTDAAQIEFDLSTERIGPDGKLQSGLPPKVTVRLINVRTFDVSRGQLFEEARQDLGPYEIPIPLARKTQFENLPRLRRYASAPETSPEMRDKLAGFRRRLLRTYAYQSILESLDPGQGGSGKVVFTGPGLTLNVQPEQFAVGDDEGQPLLRNVVVIEETRDANGRPIRRRLTAPSGVIRVREVLDRSEPIVQIELTGNVEIKGDPPSPTETPIKKAQERLPAATCPPESIDRLKKLTDLEILDPRRDLHLNAKLSTAREELIRTRDEIRAKVSSNIQFRASYAAGTIAVVMLGAILGAVLRGGQVLTAFGISCVPSLSVAVGTIVGRNFGDQPATHEMGVAIMWSANALLAVAAIWICLKFFKR
jgi:lipopolysaccharide export LptBFGC system permease protein LptF